MKKLSLILIALLILATPALAERIICASTTSTQNSGLFDYLLPLFAAKTGIEVHVVAVGTGAAIEMAKRGDADVVFVHAKPLELKAVEEGWFVNRRDVMYNDFVVVGPKGGKDRFKGMEKAAEVFKLIAKEELPFVSRGDNSGTHVKELAIWKDAGVEPRGNPRYMEVGQGMAKTLRVAAEKQAYALTDRGTWLSMEDRDELDMQITFEGDPALFNQYGAMAVNPARYSHVKYREAMEFVNWLVSEEGQKAIADFRDAKGNQLFTPNAD